MPVRYNLPPHIILRTEISVPDQDGKLTEEETQKATAWLNEHAKVGKCSMCGNLNWSVVPVIFNSTIYYPGGGLRVGGASVPLISIICSNCGHMEFFSAVVIGLLPREPDAQATVKSPEEVAKGTANGG